MSDKCNVHITFKNKRDANRFKKVTGVDWNFDDKSYLGFEADFEDCNDAMVDELRAAAEAGIEFIGTNGQGDYYPRRSFIATEGKITSVPLDHDWCETARLEIDWDTGEVRANPDDILAVYNHMAKIRRVKAGWAKRAKQAKRSKK
jgi:hypothetical protein